MKVIAYRVTGLPAKTAGYFFRIRRLPVETAGHLLLGIGSLEVYLQIQQCFNEERENKKRSNALVL